MFGEKSGPSNFRKKVCWIFFKVNFSYICLEKNQNSQNFGKKSAEISSRSIFHTYVWRKIRIFKISEKKSAEFSPRSIFGKYVWRKSKISKFQKKNTKIFNKNLKIVYDFITYFNFNFLFIYFLSSNFYKYLNVKLINI